MDFQYHLIEARDNFQERQQTSCQGDHRANNLVVIKKSFANFEQETAEDRAAATNLTGAKINLNMQLS